MVKTKKIISFSDWPKFSKKEILVTRKVMASGKVNYWTGNLCQKFENDFKKFFRLKNSISLANGSVALDAAVNAIDETAAAGMGDGMADMPADGTDDASGAGSDPEPTDVV